MHKVEQNYTHTHTKPTKCPKFKCNTVSVSFSACRCNSFVLSSKVGRKREKKKRGLETVLRMGSVAVACLPTAVSLLLLEALFMQISGVSLALTWPCRLCLFRVLLCGSLCYRLSPFQAHLER
jgi:peptidoglycan biosynthesis protein MviN/MurJ (putative lipid II flippase)